MTTALSDAYRVTYDSGAMSTDCIIFTATYVDSDSLKSRRMDRLFSAQLLVITHQMLIDGISQMFYV